MLLVMTIPLLPKCGRGVERHKKDKYLDRFSTEDVHLHVKSLRKRKVIDEESKIKHLANDGIAIMKNWII